MNSIFFFLIIVFIINIYYGLKKGFVAMMLPVLSNIVTLIILGCTRPLWSVVLTQWVFQDFSLILVRIVVLVLLYIILIAIVKLIIASLHILSKLPIIRFVNKLLGIVAGALAVVLEVWAFLALIYVFRDSAFGTWALPQIKQSQQLMFMYDHNLITYIVADFF